MENSTQTFAEYKNQFLEQGYFIEKDMWSLSEIENIKNKSHELSDYKNSNYTSVMNPHKLDSVFYNALANRKILAILSALFDGPVSAVQSQFFYGPPGCAGYSNHQDNFFLQADPRYFISVWTSFENTSPENGGLIVFPNSHCEKILPVREIPKENRGLGQDPNSNKVEVVMDNMNYSPVDLYTGKGDSVFIHANVIHASHNNTTQDRFRHTLLCTYIKTGTAFRSGSYAKREELPL